MITVLECSTCPYWRYKRPEEAGWLTTPRCEACGARMTSIPIQWMNRAAHRPPVPSSAKSERAPVA